MGIALCHVSDSGQPDLDDEIGIGGPVGDAVPSEIDGVHPDPILGMEVGSGQRGHPTEGDSSLHQAGGDEDDGPESGSGWNGSTTSSASHVEVSSVEQGPPRVR